MMDVIVVADFLGPKAMMFEARAYFFLVMWMQNAGKAKKFPLHFVCIGYPPKSIMWLAKKAGASISIHDPHPLGGSFNKQRGFEINPLTKHFLLLDLDIMVLHDFSSYAKLGESIAAAPDGHMRVPSSYWQKIYEAFDMPIPKIPFKTIGQEYGYTRKLVCDASDSELPEYHIPYYNGGIVYAPWSSNFGEFWLENCKKIGSLFIERNRHDPCYKAVTQSDQAGLSITIQQLKRKGYQFKRLTPQQHGSHVHLSADQLSLNKTELFHATNLGRNPLFPLLHYAQYLLAVMYEEYCLRYPHRSKWHYLCTMFPKHIWSSFRLQSRFRSAYQSQFAKPWKCTLNS